jgi:hypothetical protein
MYPNVTESPNARYPDPGTTGEFLVTTLALDALAAAGSAARTTIAASANPALKPLFIDPSLAHRPPARSPAAIFSIADPTFTRL